MNMMTSLVILSSLLCLIALSWAIDSDKAVAELQGRVYIKNKNQKKFLILDPLTEDPEPRAMVWNVPDAIPPHGGAWWYMLKSPNQNMTDYNLIGGQKWNYTLCVSMQRPEGAPFFYYLHGYIDSYHLGAPECRWDISFTLHDKSFWISNRLYGGRMHAADHSFNIDPLRRYVFQAVPVKVGDYNESWMIGRVLEPNDESKDDE